MAASSTRAIQARRSLRRSAQFFEVGQILRPARSPLGRAHGVETEHWGFDTAEGGHHAIGPRSVEIQPRDTRHDVDPAGGER